MSNSRISQLISAFQSEIDKQNSSVSNWESFKSKSKDKQGRGKFSDLVSSVRAQQTEDIKSSSKDLFTSSSTSSPKPKSIDVQPPEDPKRDSKKEEGVEQESVQSSLIEIEIEESPDIKTVIDSQEYIFNPHEENEVTKTLEKNASLTSLTVPGFSMPDMEVAVSEYEELSEDATESDVLEVDVSLDLLIGSQFKAESAGLFNTDDNVSVEYQPYFKKLEYLLGKYLPFLPNNLPALRLGHLYFFKKFNQNKSDLIEGKLKLTVEQPKDRELFLNVIYENNNNIAKKTLAFNLDRPIKDVFLILQRKLPIQNKKDINDLDFVLKMFGRDIFFDPECTFSDYPVLLDALPTYIHRLVPISLLPKVIDNRFTGVGPFTVDQYELFRGKLARDEFVEPIDHAKCMAYLKVEQEVFRTKVPYNLSINSDRVVKRRACRPSMSPFELLGTVLNEYPNQQYHDAIDTSNESLHLAHCYLKQPLTVHIESIENIAVDILEEILMIPNSNLYVRLQLVHGCHCVEEKTAGPFKLGSNMGFTMLCEKPFVFNTRICDLPKEAMIIINIYGAVGNGSYFDVIEPLISELHAKALKKKLGKAPKKEMNVSSISKVGMCVASATFNLWNFDGLLVSGRNTFNMWPNLHFTTRGYILQPTLSTKTPYISLYIPPTPTGVVFQNDREYMMALLARRYIDESLRSTQSDVEESEAIKLSANPLLRHKIKRKYVKPELQVEFEKSLGAFPEIVDDILEGKNTIEKLAATAHKQMTMLSLPPEEVLLSLMKLFVCDLIKIPTEIETKLMWEYRNFLVKDSRSLYHFATGLNSFDILCVFEFENFLLPKWKPYEEPMAYLMLLDRACMAETVIQHALSNLQKLSSQKLLLIAPQFVAALAHQRYLVNPVIEFLWTKYDVNDLYWLLYSTFENRYHSMQSFFLLEQMLWYAQDVSLLIEQKHLIDELESIADVIKAQSSVEYTWDYELLNELVDELNEKLSSSLLPVSGHLRVKRVLKSRVMSSKKRPLWLVFENADPLGQPIQIIFKKGDDVRQDILTLQLFEYFRRLWLHQSIPQDLVLYSVVATGAQCGILEVVLEAETTATVTKQYGGTFAAFSKEPFKVWLEQGKNAVEYKEAADRFTVSLANYSVACYVLGIGDRHNDNVMMKHEGPIFHIDFGHFLGNIKYFHGIKRERAPFILTPAMLEVVGDRTDELVNISQLCYNSLREVGPVIVGFFLAMLPSEMPELVARRDLTYLLGSLRPDLTQDDANDYFHSLIKQSETTFFTQINDAFHIAAH
ncbi:hypothetical protein PCE1_003066 [Barthelona sp. PCE]